MIMATKETTKKSVFETLYAINVNKHTEKKDTGRVKLTYLSWAWAWAKVKENYPDATFTIYENADGWNYHTDGHTCWVKTGVTIEGVELIEYLPVMNNRNQSIPADQVTSMDVNKAIQRSLTKAAARHGLGLYIYAGEDLPEDEQPETTPAKQPEPKPYADIDFEAELLAEAEANKCGTVAELADVYNKYAKMNPAYVREGSVFMKALSARKKTIQSQPKTTLF
jgi:hypothetical protein